MCHTFNCFCFTLTILLVLISLLNYNAQEIYPERGNYVGCYPEKIHQYSTTVYTGSVDDCIRMCESTYFRYAVLLNDKCACTNKLDEPLEKTVCNLRCPRNKSEFCGGIDARSYYDTGIRVAGPPINLQLEANTNSSLTIKWDPPIQVETLSNYIIQLNVIESFANYPLFSQPEWIAEKHEKRMELINLNPGTRYNITVSSFCDKEICGTASIIAETLIGKPSPLPRVPKILEETETRRTVEIIPATNNNGPISYYRLIVTFVDDNIVQLFNEELLSDYNNSVQYNIPYYISAEVENTTTIFVIGDGKTYRGYYNAPLPPKSHVHISIGVISIWNGISTSSYAIASHYQHIYNPILEIENSETSILVLTIACIIFGILLVCSVITYGYLHFKTRHRLQRLSDNHELTLHGPIVELENNGFMHESINKVSFKTQLNMLLNKMDSSQKFPRNSIRLNVNDILAEGDFGEILTGKLFTNEKSYDCQVHVISDDMDSQNQILFLNEFEKVIQVMPNETFLQFFGISASASWLYLLFDKPEISLKKKLIESRISNYVENNKFSKLSEECILQWLLEISMAMKFLEQNMILHKKLCSYNIYITQLNQLKISIFGPVPYIEQNKEIDLSRWFSPEVLKFQHYTIKSDIWSFGCVAWECCTLGGTLYVTINNEDLFNRIKSGYRCEQPSFVSNDLYQILLNCWNIEANERPNFEEISFTIQQFLSSPCHVISFNRTDNLFLPYYLPLVEAKN